MKENILDLFESLRFKEIILMTGFSFIGVLFVDKQLLLNFGDYSLLILSVVLFVLNIYFLNFYADFKEDKESKRISKSDNFSRETYLYAFYITGVVLLGLLFFYDASVVFYYLVSLLLWSCYYLPPLRLKTSMLFGTFIHLLAGVFHFHLAYCFFSPFNEFSLSIAVFFGFLLSIGHLNHEVLDYENDLKSGLKTTTVRIGLVQSKRYQFILILIALLYSIFVFLKVDSMPLVFSLFIVPLIVLLFYMMNKNKIDPIFFQKISRYSYLVVGVIYFVAKIIL